MQKDFFFLQGVKCVRKGFLSAKMKAFTARWKSVVLFIAHFWLSATAGLAVGEAVCKHFDRVQRLSLLAAIWEGKGGLSLPLALTLAWKN